MTGLQFQLATTWLWAVPLAVVILACYFFALRRRGCSGRQVLTLMVLRSVTLLLLLLLLGRPFWVETEPNEPPRRQVTLLVDRSQSMSLREGTLSRYQQAVDFARDRLLSALDQQQLQASAYLFAEEARQADGQQIAQAIPDGPQTDLAGAIVRAVNDHPEPPLAVIALTDGAANRTTQNRRAMAALVENGIPFVGVGFGSETGGRVLSLERVTVPPRVGIQQQFQVSVQLRATGDGQLPTFDLILLRNGRFSAQKRVAATKTPRVWQESFLVSEPQPGFCEYRVELLKPEDPTLICTQREGASAVRVSQEQVLRVLFVQGGLTWDFKFVRLAVQTDPSLALLGLSRTSHRSVLFQNLQDDQELVGGFPSSLDRLSLFGVVVLSNLTPQDLTPQQQELLRRYCGEYGGGLLMIGGADTFRPDWQRTGLEQLLPVTFAGDRAGHEVRVQPTAAALRHSVFQISDDANPRSAWSALPAFSDFAVVKQVKPGAEVWLEDAWGGRTGTPLMVVQRYGNGVSAALCVQNFWRWRLAKDADPTQFDRFWRQLLRFLAEGNRQLVRLVVLDQTLEPNTDIRVQLESPAAVRQPVVGPVTYTVEVVDARPQIIHQQSVQLHPEATSAVSFRATEPGLITIRVLDRQGVVQATRSIEVRSVSSELSENSRKMETLRQWARLSGGLAVKVEDCRQAADLVAELNQSLDQVRQQRPRSWPAGINLGTLGGLLGCLCVEWILRKRWDLT